MKVLQIINFIIQMVPFIIIFLIISLYGVYIDKNYNYVTGELFDLLNTTKITLQLYNNTPSIILVLPIIVTGAFMVTILILAYTVYVIGVYAQMFLYETPYNVTAIVFTMCLIFFHIHSNTKN